MSWLEEVFASQLESALEMMSGEKPSIHSPAPADPPSGLFVWQESFNVDEARAWCAGDADGWTRLGTALLRAAGIEEVDDASARSTFAEALAQAFSGLASELSRRAQREIAAAGGGDAGELPAGQTWVRLEVELSASSPSTLFLAFSPEMQALVSARVAAPTPPPKETGSEVARIAPPEAEHSKTLDLLLDVELPVSVSFGRAQLPLKEIIKLTTGSIVELNRTVGEPVEVIINNCVIARGEVVVVEGNFGVRVQQVVSRHDRLRTLY